ncbi:MAG: transporter [Lachnospiraceae bacterium]|nr:transporter [Lachnospiraceae bacterium]
MQARNLILLHMILMIYSLSSVVSKIAAGADFLSFRFCLCYGMVFLILGIYAVGWQQVIKKMPLTTAYANKAVTIIWGVVWGLLIFSETVSIKQIIGAVIVIAGVILFSTAEEAS